MARKLHMVLEDDIDGTTAVESLAFTIDGVSYEIDLNAEHAEQFREAVAPWVGAARRVGGRRHTTKTTSGGSDDLAAIRAWAIDQGMNVAARGRISGTVREAYYAAH